MFRLESTLTTSLVVVFFLCTQEVLSKTDQYRFKDGILCIDSLVDLYKDVATIKGDWEFYWGNLLTPDSFRIKTYKPELVAVPASWTGYSINGNALPVEGFATYRLKIVNPSNIEALQLKFTSISTSCRIWVDNLLVDEQGTITTSAKDSRAQRLKSYIALTQGDTVSIVIQVSNFRYFIAGINYQVELGRKELIQEYDRRLEGVEMLIVGMLLLMLGFNLLMHFQVKRGRAFLLLAAASFTILYRATLVYDGSLFLFRLFPQADFLFLKRIEILLVCTNVVLGPTFIQSIFPFDGHKKALSFLQTGGALLVISCLFMPMIYHGILLNIFYLGITLSFLFMILVVATAIKNKRSGAWAILVGMILEGSFTAAEIFNYKGYIHLESGMPNNFATLGVVIFLSFFSVTVSAQFSSVLRTVESLSANLEKLVEQRTGQLLQSNIVKSKLFSIISHDLRGPFNSLLGIVDLATSDRIKGDEIKQIMIPLKKTLQSNRQLLENLLSWSSIQMNGIKFNPMEHSLALIVEECSLLYNNELLAKGLKLEVTIGECVHVRADRNMIQLVFRNLLSNAIKFTPNTGTIKVHAEETDKDVWVSVSDSGVGMTDEQCNNLFTLGKSTSTRGTNNEKGTGLGLLLCKEFIEINHGKLQVTTEKNAGTTFRFSMPIGTKSLSRAS